MDFCCENFAMYKAQSVCNVIVEQKPFCNEAHLDENSKYLRILSEDACPPS